MIINIHLKLQFSLHLSLLFLVYSNEPVLTSNLKTLRLFNLYSGILLVLVHTNFNYRLFSLVTRQATESITAESLNKVDPEITSQLHDLGLSSNETLLSPRLACEEPGHDKSLSSRVSGADTELKPISHKEIDE